MKILKKHWSSALIAGCILAAALAFGGCSAKEKEELNTTAEKMKQEGDVQKFQREDVAMGTLTTAVIYTSGENLTGKVIEEISHVEDDYISWRVEGSDIDKMNKSAGDANGTAISDSTAGYLKQILELSQVSDGALDPTIGRITRLWDIDGENPKVPQQSELEKLLADCGYEKVKLQENQAFLEANTSVDLGAVGKGIGCDVAVELLTENPEVSGAVISVGGSIVVYGEKPDGSDWQVAITNPDDDTDYMGVLTLSGENYVSTSGDYEKYFEENGVRYHHIMDPATGYPAESGLVSVSILTDNGLLSDGLSTACFVLGIEKSLPVLEHYGAEAIFVDRDHKVYLTDGIRDRFELLREDFELGQIPGQE